MSDDGDISKVGFVTSARGGGKGGSLGAWGVKICNLDHRECGSWKMLKLLSSWVEEMGWNSH
jgi:hypothetical protein